MPQWTSVLRNLRETRDKAEVALHDAVVAGDLDAADFARIWLADAQRDVEDLEERYRGRLDEV